MITRGLLPSLEQISPWEEKARLLQAVKGQLEEVFRRGKFSGLRLFCRVILSEQCWGIVWTGFGGRLKGEPYIRQDVSAQERGVCNLARSCAVLHPCPRSSVLPVKPRLTLFIESANLPTRNLILSNAFRVHLAKIGFLDADLRCLQPPTTTTSHRVDLKGWQRCRRHHLRLNRDLFFHHRDISDRLLLECRLLLVRGSRIVLHHHIRLWDHLRALQQRDSGGAGGRCYRGSHYSSLRRGSRAPDLFYWRRVWLTRVIQRLLLGHGCRVALHRGPHTCDLA